jgi:hypothetical protein
MKPPKKAKKARRAKAKKRARSTPKKVTITTRVKRRVVVENPKRKKKRAKKKAAPKKRTTTVTVRPNPKKRRVPKDELGPLAQSIVSRHGKRHPGDRARPNAAYWRQPRAARASNLRKLARGTPRQKRAAVAIAKCEVSEGRGPPRRSNPGAMSDEAALREYERTHWGERGGRRVSTAAAPNPRHGTATKLGKLVSVVYLTEKGGDDGPTEYEHEFEGKLPELVYNDGGLLIAGGSYRIKEGGIDG